MKNFDIQSNFTTQELYSYLNTYKSANWVLPLLFKSNSFFVNCKLRNLDYSKYAFYGSPQISWNAGRKGENINLPDALSKLDSIQQFQIPIFFTFTRYNIEKNLLDDTFGNVLLQYINDKNKNISYEKQHGVILSSDLLHTYIRRNYPYIKTKCSILKSTLEYKSKDIDWYKNMLNSYDDVILHVDFDLKNLNCFDVEDRGRLEILVNEKCIKNCKFRASYCYLQEDIINHPKCIAKHKGIVNTILSSVQIEYILSMGIKKLKLQGRTEIKL